MLLSESYFKIILGKYMADTGRLESDMVFLGLTRSSMIFGVSYLVVVTNFLASIMFYIITTDAKAFLSMAVVHAIAYFASQKEPLFLELFMSRQQKCNKCKNRFFFGMTNSYDLR